MYSDSEYSYDDAADLARFWGFSTAWEAKLKIGRWIMEGKETDINQDLNDARAE
ncbi:MAG: hypothetical protein KDK39_06840 [Leptospiraceae bacterium]|nr:hypothetical protein [Leptospiraceae bacterium]